MERNVEKIKRLEHELGRYRKKAADQGKELAGLRRQREEAESGGRELQRLVDALLAEVTVAYGVAAGEENGEALGWRLELPGFSAEETLGRYELRVRRDGERGYVLGVIEKNVKI